MADTLFSSDAETGDTGSMLQQYAEKVAQALEMETNKMREKAEHDSSEILTRSKQEAEKIIARAEEEARGESEKLLAGLREQAEQILNESREKAAEEARQESNRVMNETYDKISQVITDTLEDGITGAKDDFVQAAAEAKKKLENEKSKLLAITKSIESVISETESNIQAGIDRLTAIAGETGEKLGAIKQGSGNGTEETPQPVTGTSINTIYTVKFKKHEAEPPAAEEITNASIEEPEQLEQSEDHEDAEKLMQKGLAMFASGQNEEALEVFDKVIELDPKNPVAWRKKGATLDRLGRHDESLKAYGKAIELAPHYISECLSNELAIARKIEQTEEEETVDANKESKKQNANGRPSKLSMISKRFVSTRFF